ncbi:MAG: metallophosphoesterase [Pseudomonadota bacterium]
MPPTSPSDDPRHTFAISDIHLSDAQVVDPARPLWKRFKGRDLFIDDSLARCLAHLRELAGAGEPIELVLNGDIFDFDSVMALPRSRAFPVNWLERLRGLDAEQDKSVFKIQVILGDHPAFVTALREFLNDGHQVAFVIGNHDMELHWPEVQAEIRRALDLTTGAGERLRFCEWFTLSGGDTLLEHGNQYDSYCAATDPVHPRIRWRGIERMRLPFGNLAGKLMLNGMGLFNPHVESSFIRSLPEYAVFFWRYMLRIQPLLPWTWFWTALLTLVITVREGLAPTVRDPFSLDEQVEGIALRARATPRLVRALPALRVRPAYYNPLSIARELWLDRALLLALVLFGTFQLFSILNVFVTMPIWWWLVFFVLLLPLFILYARGVHSDVDNYERGLRRLLPEVARLAGVTRLVMGHTHKEKHTEIEGVELLNSGTWSPAYHDVECTRPFGRTCFVWLHPQGEGSGRVAELRQWQDPGSQVIPRDTKGAQRPSPIVEKFARITDKFKRVE